MWPFGRESKSSNKQSVGNSQTDWKILEEESQLDKIIATSAKKPVVIFKHSTSCSISSMAMSRLKRGWEFSKKADFYYLDLIRYRAISNKIEALFGVTHQSPQVLVIVKGKAVFDTSHNDVSVQSLEPFVNK